MVITGRPRAHSASSIKFTQVIGVRGGGGGGGGGERGKLSYSSPELRSMLVGLETTVPQNLNPSHLGSRHKPHRRRNKMGSRASLAHTVDNTSYGGGAGVSGGGGDGCCRCCCRCCGCGGGGSCCQVNIFLVLMQFLVGVGVTAVSVYLYLFLPVFPLRETPFWAGAPLCAAGILGIYFCAASFTHYSKTTRAFVLKVLCSIMSAISVFVNVIAAIFTAIHLGRIFTFQSCRQQSQTECHCYLSRDEVLPRVFVYNDISDCFVIFCEVKMYLLVVGSLCLAGSLFSLWFIILLWKARYGRFYSGVRLHSFRRRDNDY